MLVGVVQDDVEQPHWTLSNTLNRTSSALGFRLTPATSASSIAPRNAIQQVRETTQRLTWGHVHVAPHWQAAGSAQ